MLAAVRVLHPAGHGLLCQVHLTWAQVWAAGAAGVGSLVRHDAAALPHQPALMTTRLHAWRRLLHALQGCLRLPRSQPAQQQLLEAPLSCLT